MNYIKGGHSHVLGGHVFSFRSVSKEFKGLVKFFTDALSFIVVGFCS